MAQPSTKMMKIVIIIVIVIISPVVIRYSTSHLILRDHKENLKPSSLPSKQRLVSWYSCYFNNLFILHQMSEGKAKKRESIVWGSTQLCAAFCDFISKSLPTKAVQGGKTSCASFCVSLIAGSRRAFLCVDCVCLLLEFWEKCMGCERLLPVKHFYLSCLLFFRRLTLDSEQPMLKEKQIILSVWGGIKGFEHFLKGEYFSDCASDYSLWADFAGLN